MVKVEKTISKIHALVPHQAVIPFDHLFRSFESDGGVRLLYGNSLCFRLSLRAIAQTAVRGGTVAVIDGCNQFDVHALIHFARERRCNADQLLHRVHISRGFTCYQMEQAVARRLPEFLRSTGCRNAVVFGLLDTFYDQQAPLREVQQILKRVLEAVQGMKAKGISLLIVCTNWNVSPRERQQLFTVLKNGIETVYRLESAEPHLPQLVLEKGAMSDGTNCANLYQPHRQRAGELVEIPARTSKRRPGRF